MTKQYEMPGRINRRSRFFTLFTAPDLVRVSLPLAIAYFVIGPTLAGMEMAAVYTAAAIVGVIWWLGKPFSQHLDTLVYHVVRWLLAKRGIEGPDIEEIELGYAITADEAAVALFEIEPINIEMQSDTDQDMVHNRYQDLFRTVSFPVYIYSRQRPLDLSEYVKFIEEKATSHTELRQEYIEHVRELSAGDHTATRHFVAIRVEKGSKHWLYDHLPNTAANRLPIENGSERGKHAQITELRERCRTVRRTLSSPKIDVKGIAGRELYELVEEFNETNPQPGARWTSRSSSDDSEKRDEYRRSAYIHEFRRKQRLGWPLDLLRIDGQVDVAQRVEPRDRRTATRKLNRLKIKLNAEIASYLSQGHLGTHNLERLEEDVDDMSELLAEGEDVIVDYSAAVTAHSEEREHGKRTFEDICEELEAKQIEYRQPVFRTDHAYRMDSPLYGDGLNESLLLPATSAAAGFPAATQEPDQTGVLYGVDANDESPVILDRFSWDAGHMVIMGRTGSGKTYFEEVELQRFALACPEVNVYAVDPKNDGDYASLFEYLGGSVKTLDPDTDYRFDNQYICFDTGDAEQLDYAEAMLNAVRQIYDATTRSDQPTLVVIDEAHNLTEMEDDDGFYLLSKFIREARSTNTAVTLLSQSASDFTGHHQGEKILGNAPATVFMKHKTDDVDNTVVDYFDLSQREKREISSLETGNLGYSEAIVKVEDRLDAKIRVKATDEEHRIIEELDAEEEEHRSTSLEASQTEFETTDESGGRRLI